MASQWTLPISSNKGAPTIGQFGTSPPGSDERLFYSLHPINGVLTGDQVRPILESFSLPQNQLASIWGQVDRDADGKINISEFCQAMSLVRQAKLSSPTWSPSLNTLPHSRTTGSTVGVVNHISPITSSSQNWSLSPHEEKRYRAMFASHDRTHTGYLSAGDAQPLLTRSDLSRDVLRQIWDLSDADKDGKLSKDEFVIAMFLVDKAKQGCSLPSVLPVSLQPSSTSSNISAGSYSPGGSFEEKRRAHFEQGRLELERRQKQLQEQLNKEKEEKERKRREQEELKQQQLREAERLRQLELERQRQRAMEIERERERERQQLALQLEAQAREAERKRKEEWAKKRQAELEQQREVERTQLLAIKHAHQELVDLLAKLDMERGSLQVKVEQQRQLCKQLAASLDSLRQVAPPHRSKLTSLSAQLSSQRKVLVTLQQQHRSLQQSMVASKSTTGGSQQISTDKIEALKSSVTSLKVEHAQNRSDTERVQNVLREKNSSLMNLQAELRQLTRNNKKLTDDVRKRHEILKQEKEAEAKRQLKLSAAKQKAAQYQHQSTILEKREKRLSGVDLLSDIPTLTPTTPARPQQLATTHSENDVRQKVKQLQEKKKLLQKQKKEAPQQPTPAKRTVVSPTKPVPPPKPKSILSTPLPKPPTTSISITSQSGHFTPTSQQPSYTRSQPNAVNTEPIYDEPPLDSVNDTSVVKQPFQRKPSLEPTNKPTIQLPSLPKPPVAAVRTAVQPSSQEAIYDDPEVVVRQKAAEPLTSPTAKPLSSDVQYRARYSFSAASQSEVSFNQGDILYVLPGEDGEEGWARVRCGNNEGWAPRDYLDRVNLPNEASSGEQATVMFSWEGVKPNHLSITKGEKVLVLQHGNGWLMGEGPSKKVGWFPESYVQLCDSNVDVPNATVSSQSEAFVATYSYSGPDGDLSFNKGDIITVVSRDGDWWTGQLAGRSGTFPSTYVHPLSSTQSEPAITGKPSLQQSTSTIDKPSPTDASVNSDNTPTTRKLVGRVEVAFEAQQSGQLSLSPGQLVLVRQQQSNGWWEGELQTRHQNKQAGWFPGNRVKLLSSSSLGTSQSLKPTPRVPRTPTPQPEPASPISGSLVLALYTYQANSSDELSFHKGSVITLISKEEAEWWKGELNGQTGLFPCNYVQSLDTLPNLKPEAKKWSDYVSSDVVDKVPRETRKRQEAIFELVSTEKSYVDSLNLVKEVFFDPMTSRGVLSDQERSQVVVNWDELIQCNSALCNALFIRLRMSGAIVRTIGDILVEHIPKLHPHIRWCSCQLNACKLLQLKSSEQSFREFEQQCVKDQRTGGLPLSSFLLKPMQRITKYPLLIERVIEHTSETEPDLELLKLALRKSEDLCVQINKTVRQHENTEKLEWLQSHVQLTLSERLVFNSQTNFMGARQLIHWGKLTKVRGNKEFVVLLFNDFLMLLTRPKGLFTSFAELEPFTTDHNFTMYRQPFLLDTLRVKALPDDQYGPSVFSLIVANEEKDIPLRSSSNKARDKWVKNIMDACVQYARQKKQDIRLQRSNSVRQTLLRESVGKLFVTVVEAADLVASDPNGKSDPFCVLKLGESQEQATPVINNTLNPRWNHMMNFVVTDLESSVLELTVFDSDLFSPNDFLGCARISLPDLLKENSHGPWNKRLLLEDVKQGEIELRLSLKLNR